MSAIVDFKPPIENPFVAREMSVDEFLDGGHGDIPCDYIDGKAVPQPMPHRKHGFICANVVTLLNIFVMSAKIGRVISNDTFVLTRKEPTRIRGADVFYLSYDRLPPGEIPAKDIEPAPELVVEVRSPSDTWKSLVAKALEYLDAGVKVVLLLDADSQTVSVYRVDQVQEVLSEDDLLTLPDVLPGFSTSVRRFFEG